jgi:putative transposase
MARQARLAVPGHPHHLLIRGHNQQPIFVDDQDRQRLLEHLAEALRNLPLALHAYVLMPNHLHLLATPQAADTLGRAAQSLGRRYVGYFNARHGRSGTLWEGRYRANVVGGYEEVLRCMRFIESNPQRSGLANAPSEPAWSSLAHHLGALRDPLITEPAAYWQLGNTPFEREAAYRAWMEQGVGQAESRRIVSAVTGGRVLGNKVFVLELERQLGRTLTPRPRGRPRKVVAP